MLRPLEPEDLDQLYVLENTLPDWEHSNMSAPLSQYMLREYISSQRCDLTADGQIRLVVCNEDDKETVIGLADIFNFDARHRRAEVGIIIDANYRNQGYATKAVNELTEYARHTCLIDQLYAYVASGNDTSVKVFENCGYQHTATLRNWFINTKSKVDALVFQLFLKKD